MSRPVKVLFLTRYPKSGASSRYRVFQYLPYLPALGIQPDVQSFMDEEMYRLSFSRGRFVSKLFATLRATARRLQILRKADQYDLVVMQRELFPFGPPVLERRLKARGLPLIFDYDDALFIAKPSRYNRLATILRSPEKIRAILRMVDLVLAGNDWLRDQAIAVGGRAQTLEVAEDVTRFAPPPASRRADRVTIGWLGSSSTVKYLHLIAPVLRELARQFPDLRFVQMGGGEFQMEGVPWQQFEWSLEAEVKVLGEVDIGLMPLPDEDWGRGKSGGKARTYMAAGVVPVCSSIGYNRELIEHGCTGFLCETQDEWRAALLELVSQRRLRERVGLAAREVVARRFDPQLIAQQLADTLRSVIPSRA